MGRTKQLAGPGLVFPQSITGHEEEDCFQCQDASVEPARRFVESVVRPVRDVRDGGSHGHPGMELVVFVVNVDQQRECLFAGGQP